MNEQPRPSPLTGLAYLGVSAPDVSAWADYASRRLGMEVVDRSRTSTALRMDRRRQRLMINDGPDQHFFGWETRGRAGLDDIVERLAAARVAVRPMTVDECARRFVGDGVVFSDPAGNRVEVVVDPADAGTEFRPGRPHSGFRTGALGMGHVVLTAVEPDVIVAFYRDVVGFGLSDYCLTPFKAYFLHLNTRHHSLAVVEAPRDGIHHLMVEMNSFDDVGQAYDLALADDSQIAVTLGRHSNDHMFSFYSRTPSEFMVECGWGGRSIDPASWTPCELLDGPSLWGHDRRWLPPEVRAAAYDLRVAAAARGVRAPVHVQSGNFTLTPDPVERNHR